MVGTVDAWYCLSVREILEAKSLGQTSQADAEPFEEIEDLGDDSAEEEEEHGCGCVRSSL